MATITKDEFKVIEQKALNPNEKVYCPRCGKELLYDFVGNSYEVKCPTKDCIHVISRGL